jgi:hypothetical protein
MARSQGPAGEHGIRMTQGAFRQRNTPLQPMLHTRGSSHV